jgi:hypothetical protein
MTGVTALAAGELLGDEVELPHQPDLGGVGRVVVDHLVEDPHVALLVGVAVALGNAKDRAVQATRILDIRRASQTRRCSR